jgi:hypothetical protein
MINTTNVSGNKTTFVEQREIKPIGVSTFSSQPLVQECKVNVLGNQWNTDSDLEQQFYNKEQSLKHWFTTVQLDESLLRRCSKDNFSCIISKVDPVLRVVVIKCRKQQMDISLTTPIKRIICLPEHVDCSNVNVSICQQRKVIIVKAPFRYTPEQVCERELSTEYEPTVYKVLNHLRQSCPRFMVPRYIRDVQSGLHKIYLDVHCSGFRPEETRLSINNGERLLTFKAFRQLDNEMWQHKMGFFQRYLRHELTLPMWINLDKVSSYKLNNDVLRVNLPITKLPTLEEMKLNYVKDTQIVRKQY